MKNKTIQVEVINKSKNELPKYANEGDAGMDLRADFSHGINEDFMWGAAWDDVAKCLRIFPNGRALIPTGIYSAIPKGYEVQVRSRSGLALKHGLFVLNSPGTIDSGYRDGWGVIIQNLGDDDVEIYQGDRIAQAVLNKVEQIEWKEVSELSGEDRGGGFGSTGKS